MFFFFKFSIDIRFFTKFDNLIRDDHFDCRLIELKIKIIILYVYRTQNNSINVTSKINETNSLLIGWFEKTQPNHKSR